MVLMRRRHQADMAALQQQCAQDDLRARHAAAVHACLLMKQQVAASQVLYTS